MITYGYPEDSQNSFKKNSSSNFKGPRFVIYIHSFELKIVNAVHKYTITDKLL